MKIMKNKKFAALLMVLLLSLALAAPVYAAAESDGASVQAEETVAEKDNTVGIKAISAGVAIGLAAAGGALAMGMAGAKSVEGIARQPEAEGKIRTTLMLNLVFIETAIIYALLVVILIVFVL